MLQITCVKLTYGWLERWDGFCGEVSFLSQSSVLLTGISLVEEFPGEVTGLVVVMHTKNQEQRALLEIGVIILDTSQFMHSLWNMQNMNHKLQKKQLMIIQDLAQLESWKIREERFHQKMLELFVRFIWSIIELQVHLTTIIHKTSIHFIQKSIKKLMLL